MTREQKLEAALRKVIDASTEYLMHGTDITIFCNQVLDVVTQQELCEALATPHTSKGNEAIEAAASAVEKVGLLPGHCEVHPHVHEEYPCSVCVAESNIKQQEEFGRSWADSELRMLRADLAQATKERDGWKTKAEANEREARLYQWIVHEPESARHLLNLLREGKGTIDNFGQIIERIAASKQAARSADTGKRKEQT